MAALASGIFNHSMTAAQSLAGTGATPMSASTTGAADASSTSTSSAAISANDFLTLLVTEMKNQDPTANTDPNQYINQLVNVNSLEQLIDINQNLSAALGTPSSKAGISAPQTASAATAPIAPASTGASPYNGLSAMSQAAKNASGNLTAPDVLPAAQSVAHTLGGRVHLKSAVAQLPQAN